jgi:hypothetical protein
LSWTFYRPTKYGVKVVGDFNYLGGVPMAQAVITKTRTTEKITRHMEAPRPSLQRRSAKPSVSLDSLSRGIEASDASIVRIDLLTSEMRDRVECLSPVSIFRRTRPNNQPSIDEFSEVVTEVVPVIVDSDSEFFPSDFLPFPEEEQNRVAPLVTECCFSGSVVSERTHTVIEQPLVNVLFELSLIRGCRRGLGLSGH